MRKIIRFIDIPPSWLLFFMGAGWGLDEIAPLGLVAPTPIVGGVVMACGVVLAVWAALVFRRSKTPVFPRRRPEALVRSGPYAVSRNPIYVADLVILLGWSAAIGSAWPAFLTPLFMLILQKRFIDGEEAALREGFPEEWEDWSAKTRRWL
ncbi:MAG: isoprenylcysteine carboxylmethyltransferase family protein [Pseudomonadota bacterium]